MKEFNLSNYLVANKGAATTFGYQYIPRIVCKDGFSMSVQCHSGSYCQPRQDGSDFYYQVEVGFPSAKPECFAHYAEDGEDYTDTVYGYVPIELVQEEIEFHGGIVPSNKESN